MDSQPIFSMKNYLGDTANMTSCRKCGLGFPASFVMKLITKGYIIGLAMCLCLGLVGCNPDEEDYQSDSVKLAIAKLEYSDKSKVEYLTNDYGFLIQWQENHPALLYVYNKPKNTIRLTSDFPLFLEYLKQFPDSVKVDRKRGCAITSMGMSQEQTKQLEEVIVDKGFILTDEYDGNFPICTCETIKVTWFDTANSLYNQTSQVD